MRKTRRFTGWLVLLLAIPSLGLAQAVDSQCRFKGITLRGKVKQVQSGGNIRVQKVNAFPDLKVQVVKTFPDKCGQWQWVESFPDFTVEFVQSFPDLKIKFVDTFPGKP